MIEVGHIRNGVIDLDTVTPEGGGAQYSVGVSRIDSLQSVGRIITFELTGTRETAATSGNHRKYENPDNFTVYVFNEEQALYTFAEENSIEIPEEVVENRDNPETSLTRNPACHLVFTDSVAADAAPEYPKLVSLRVNEDWHLGRVFQIHNTGAPFYANKTRYRLYILVKFEGESELRQLQYKVLVE